MSFRNVQGNNISARTLRAAAPAPAAQWVRNPAWPVLTAPTSGEQKLSGLYAIWPGDGVGNGGNFFAVNCAAAYTVDFGDGTSVNTATGVQTNYEYNFADVDLYDATVTLTDAGDLVERTAHGYTDGMRVQFYRIVTTTGLVEAQFYFVVNATANNFQVAATAGGAALALTTNGSASLLPYKIATVTVTPQAGQNLTTVNLFVKEPTTGLQAYSTGWLDLAIAGPNITSLTIGGSATTLTHSYLENVNLVQLGSVASFASLFTDCRKLQSVSINTPLSVTNMSLMFNSCPSLVTVPLFNTAAVTNMQRMFSNCTSLVTVPLFNTAAVTNMSQMFQSCSSLATVPLFNTALVTNMQSMFSSCSSLVTVPLFNTASVTNMQSMFSSCLSLATVPLFNTALVTNMSQMLSGCSSLATVPLFNTASVTIISQMFQGCSSLVTVPLFNTAAVTNSAFAFQNCSALTAVPAFVVTAVTSGNLSNMFAGCSSLARIQAKNFRFSFSVASCKLSAAALDEIYTNLPTVTAQTLAVTGNYGAVGDDPSIAVAKGWTVTG